MNIKVEIKKILKGDKPTKAYANIVIDDAVVIHGVGVVENEKGRYMSMPMTSWKTSNGEDVTRPVCHPMMRFLTMILNFFTKLFKGELDLGNLFNKD